MNEEGIGVMGLDAESDSALAHIIKGEVESILPDYCVIGDKVMSDLKYRLDMAVSQLLSAVVLSFTSTIGINIYVFYSLYVYLLY